MKASIPIPVPTTVTAGAAVDLNLYDDLSAPALILAAGTITVQFQESYDNGVTWLSVGAALSATGKAAAVPDRNATHIRANTTAAAGATATGHIAGHLG